MEYWNIGKIKIQLVFLVVLSFVARISGQTFDPFIQGQVDAVDYDSVYLRMKTFENMGIKTAGSASLENTRDWIIALYQQWGYTDIELDDFSYSQSQVQNIIVTKPGTLYPDTYIIVDGHYDTYGGPGVNDNGSGTAIVLETARLMKDLETAYSIKFIHFTVEEMGLVGSTHYVENTVVPENIDIRLVFNIDEVGGVAGEVNNTVTCERDEWPPNGNNAASAAFTDTLAVLTELYSSLNTSISYAYGSDYVPFMNNGYVVTGYYEYNESPYPHSIDDSLSNLDAEYVFELAKAALASTMHFSGAYETITEISAIDPNQGNFIIEPNPFKERFRVVNEYDIDIRFELFDLQGKPVLGKTVISSTAYTIEANLKPGIYFYQIRHKDKVLRSGKLIGK